MPDNPVISFRIRADIKRGIQKLANEDRRSLSQYIENCLEDHIKEAEAKKRHEKC
jgi:predicted transcriptional regulator